MNRVTELLYQYYRKKYIKYRNKVLSEKEIDFDIYKIEHEKPYICGIDNDICLEKRCTENFDKNGCMFLK